MLISIRGAHTNKLKEGAPTLVKSKVSPRRIKILKFQAKSTSCHPDTNSSTKEKTTFVRRAAKKLSFNQSFGPHVAGPSNRIFVCFDITRLLVESGMKKQILLFNFLCNKIYIINKFYYKFYIK